MSVFIIAEAGVNHNGDINIAKQLVDVAVEAGADAVKFQTFKAENLACRHAKKANYQLQTTEQNETQFDMLKKLEITYEMHMELMEYCKQKHIQFLSTAFDIESLELLLELDIAMIKIPSGEITNLPYLRKIAMCAKPIILSTGMSTLEEVKVAINILMENGNKDIIILHCTTQYPTPYEDANLSVIPYMKEQCSVRVGYSDHTKGIVIPIAAVAMGAEVVEKHFTLNKELEGPDHKASLEPHELKEMVASIRIIEQAMGQPEKMPSNSEYSNISIVRKSIVAKQKIRKEELFTEENLTAKRPGTGISPMEWDGVIGTKATRDYEMDELIER